MYSYFFKLTRVADLLLLLLLAKKRTWIFRLVPKMGCRQKAFREMRDLWNWLSG